VWNILYVGCRQHPSPPLPYRGQPVQKEDLMELTLYPNEA
jgi:hypothetical protein